MKPGLTKGFTQQVTVTVTPDMYPDFDGSVIHPLYSTSTMVKHMEFASRKIILPFLEEHEEGMGISVEVQHLLPVPEGKEVTCTATFQEMIGKRILCDVQVRCGSRLVGRGFVTQAILPKEEIYKNITQAQNDL